MVGDGCCRLIRHVKMSWHKPGCQGGKGHFKEGSMEVQNNQDVTERSISLSIKWGPGELVKGISDRDDKVAGRLQKARLPSVLHKEEPEGFLCCTKELGLYGQAKVKA